MTDHVAFVDGELSQSNRVMAAWLNDVNNLTYGAGSRLRGSALLQYVPPWTSSRTMSVQDVFDQEISVFEFFTDAMITDVTTYTGSIDVRAKIILALASGRSIFFPAGKYLVGSTITMTTGNRHLRGAGRLATLFSVTGNYSAFTVACAGNTFQDLGGIGSGKGATYDAGQASNRLVYVTGGGTTGYDNLFSNVYGQDFGRACISFEQVNYNHEGNQVIAGLFVTCNIGIEFGVQGEYVSCTACIARDGNYGFYIRAGNISMTSGSATNNLAGVWLAFGSNDSHGTIVGMLINHNVDWSIYCETITNGFTFSACYIYEGDILLKGIGVKIVYGHLDVGALYFQGSTGTRILGNTTSGAYPNTIFNDYSAALSSTQWSLNRPIDGIQSAAEYLGGSVYATPANVAYAKATLFSTGLTVQWTGAAAAMYLHPSYTKQTLFASNQFVGAGLAGLASNVRCVIRVQKNAADPTADLFIVMRKGVANWVRLNPVPLSSTIVQFEISMPMPLAAAQTGDFIISTSSLYANDVTILSTEGRLEVEQL